MATITRSEVETAIKEYIDPYLEQDLISAKAVRDIRVDGDRVKVDVQLGFPAKGYQEELITVLKERIESLSGVSTVTIQVDVKVISHEVQKGLKPLSQIKNVIAIAS
ncbi:MAG: iron-sulfur cluster assembly protein, partial [Anaerolineales bacterium]